MAFGFFRGIWITLRAVNYTQAAFSQVAESLNLLQEKELAFLKSTKMMMQVGAIFIALGGFVTMGISKIISATEEGKAYMEDFSASINESLGQIGLEILQIIKPFLEIAKSIAQIIAHNPALRTMVAILILAAGPVLMLVGAVITLNQVYMLWSSGIIQKVLPALLQQIGVNTATTSSFVAMGMALAMVTAGFTIFMMLGAVIGSQAGAIVAGLVAITVAVLALAVALNVLSVGTLTPAQLGAFAAGAGIAAGVMAIQSQAPEYQMGTRMATKTGIGVFHKGEVVYNPENQLPTQINRGLEGQPTAFRQDVTIDMSGSVIQTKADKEELLPMMKRELRNIVMAKE